MEPRVAAYLRVSTDGQTLDSQRKELEEYCARRGWTKVEWYEDVASGARRDRTGLNILMDRVRRGKVDTIVAFKLDRLARSLAHLAQMTAELRAHNVALVCPSQGIDTTDANPCGQFQLNILAAVAEFERGLITERVNAGIAAAKQRGVKLGRPPKANHRRQRVQELLEQGRSTSEISKLLTIPYSTVGEMVRELKGSGR